MPINKNDPQYKQRVAVAEKIAKEIEHSVATNSHVAEERIIDNVGEDDGVDEEEVRHNPAFL
jgi:PAB1-binding protein PBP1